MLRSLATNNLAAAAGPVHEETTLPSRHDPIIVSSRGCKYVHGSPRDGDWSYCGKPTIESGSSWCADHHALVYGKRPQKQKQVASMPKAAAREVKVASLEDPMLLGSFVA